MLIDTAIWDGIDCIMKRPSSETASAGVGDKTKGRKRKKTQTVLGWREWVALPDFGIAGIKAKIDTGARTSALHATHIEIFTRRGKKLVRFKFHPMQDSAAETVSLCAEMVEHRLIKSSVGHVTERPVIVTTIQIGDEVFDTQLTLVNRALMGFRLLIGRRALRRRFLVDPARSYLVEPGD